MHQKEIILIKRAFFIIGPESSGTRMMTQAFIACGAYGDGGHAQRLDEEGFDNGHKMIAIRRSVPHGTNMPQATALIRKMQKSKYNVFPIVILRDKDKCAQSQVRNGHAENLLEAKNSIKTAIMHIYNHLYNFQLPIHVMHYEPFVKSEKIRKSFFKRFQLPPPDMKFYNANEKYK